MVVKSMSTKNSFSSRTCKSRGKCSEEKWSHILAMKRICHRKLDSVDYKGITYIAMIQMHHLIVTKWMVS